MRTQTDKVKLNQDFYRSTLRSSTQFLNLHLLRTSLSSYTYQTANIHPINTPSATSIQNKTQNDGFQMKRFSSMHTLKPYSGQDILNEPQSCTRLKDTLSHLQDKITKAQQILSQTQSSNKKLGKKQPKQVIFDIQASLQDMDEISTKNNEYNQKFNNNQSKLSVNSTTKTLKMGNSNHQNTKPKFTKYNKQYYTSSLLTMDQPKADPRIKQHINLNFDVIKKLGNCEPLQHKQLSAYKINIPAKSDKKTLLLDIDDTILNCDDQKIQGIKYDFQLTIEGEDGQIFPVYIKLRPYAITFLKNMSKVYQIIAFTGSIQDYVNKVIQQIDPEGEIFSYKLHRDSCFQFCLGVYVKDIRIINRRPENIVLVDNSPYSYLYQLENGIPILPYQQGPDEQLPKLQKYLLSISKQKDLRQVNKNTFKFHRYHEFKNVNQMISALYQGQDVN